MGSSKMIHMNLFFCRNKHTDVDNKCMDTKGNGRVR